MAFKNNAAPLSNDELQSKVIDWLRFPLIVGVVYIHMNPKVSLKGLDYSQFDWNVFYNLLGVLGTKVIPSIAVPSFFLFSGFLFFYKLKTWNFSVYKQKLKTRLHTLLIPYILWNILPIFGQAIFKQLKYGASAWVYLQGVWDKGLFAIFWKYHSWGTESKNMIGWPTPAYGPFNLPLWFLRDLIICVLFTPIIYYFVKQTKFYGILLLSVLYYTKIWILFPGFSIKALFFFSFGAYFSIFNKNILVSFQQYKYLILAITLIAVYLTTFGWGTYSRIKGLTIPIYVISGTISAINITAALIKRNYTQPVAILSNSSFFIYAMHTTLVLGVCASTYDYYFKPESGLAMSIRYITVPILCISICIGLYVLLRKLSPSFLKTLTGNR